MLFNIFWPHRTLDFVLQLSAGNILKGYEVLIWLGECMHPLFNTQTFYSLISTWTYTSHTFEQTYMYIHVLAVFKYSHITPLNYINGMLPIMHFFSGPFRDHLESSPSLEKGNWLSFFTDAPPQPPLKRELTKSINKFYPPPLLCYEFPFVSDV